jgi:hypothetical protein
MAHMSMVLQDDVWMLELRLLGSAGLSAVMCFIPSQTELVADAALSVSAQASVWFNYLGSRKRFWYAASLNTAVSGLSPMPEVSQHTCVSLLDEMNRSSMSPMLPPPACQPASGLV